MSLNQQVHVEVDPRKTLIAKSSWPKKQLADYHLESLMYCQFGCAYCSSNSGLHIRFGKKTIDQVIVPATGKTFDSHNAANVTIAYRDFVASLRNELDAKKYPPGKGKTLVYSQLTDGFSPVVVRTGTARQTLELLLEKTEFRIRVLTKNAIVGNKEWVDFFSQHSDRFTVGLSIGTLDAKLARAIEAGTSTPTSRAKALRRLQDAGVPTFGMLCPIFPSVLKNGELQELIDAIRPEKCERVWAEPYNNRQNAVDVIRELSGHVELRQWMEQAFNEGDKSLWSRCAANLYRRLRDQARDDGWIDKLRYLLYEAEILPQDADAFHGLEGVLLQSTDSAGKSRNPHLPCFPY